MELYLILLVLGVLIGLLIFRSLFGLILGAVIGLLVTWFLLTYIRPPAPIAVAPTPVPGTGAYAAPTAAPAPSANCPSQSDIALLGSVKQWVSHDGKLAGAQIRFNRTFATAWWVDEIHLNGNVVQSIQSGQVGTLWVIETCRPLR